MKIKPLILFFGITLNISAAEGKSLVEINQELFRATHQKAAKLAVIHCEYKYWLDTPEVEVIGQQFVPGLFAGSQFRIGEGLVSIVASEGGTKGRLEFQVNGVEIPAYLGGLDNINIDLSHIDPTQAEIARDYKLDQLSCFLELGREKQYLISQPEIHINMHPHPGYDVDGESLAGMQRELNIPGRQNLVLIDDDISNLTAARNANFNTLLQTENPVMSYDASFGAPDLEFPLGVDIRLSQAGHNKFLVPNPDQTIVYTGGNHNFCILNNTRRVLHGFMENPLRRSIRFEYVLDSVVVQRGSWLRRARVSRRVFNRSNLLSNVLRNMSDRDREKYLRAYFDYFKNSYLSEKQYYYSKAHISLSGIEGHEYSEIVDGLGEQEISIELVFR